MLFSVSKLISYTRRASNITLSLLTFKLLIHSKVLAPLCTESITQFVLRHWSSSWVVRGHWC